MHRVGRGLSSQALLASSVFLGAVSLLLFAAPAARAADEPAPAPPPPRRVVEQVPPTTTVPVPCYTPPSGRYVPCDPFYERRRGPVEVRDAWILAQPRLTLPATTPDTLGCGRTSIRGAFQWSNSFGWRQSSTGETPAVRNFLVDGETRTFDVTVMHGVRENLDLGLRIPVEWRGAGILDEWIDTFHEATDFLDNKRKDFHTDKYRVNGIHDDLTPFDDDDEKGAGFGNIEAIAKWRLCDGGRDGWTASLIGRATAPTGTGVYEVGGVDVGLQAIVAKRIAPKWDLYGGLGGTWFSEVDYQDVRYQPVRGNVFVAAEWRAGRTWSLILETDYATQLIEDISLYDPESWYLNIGAKIDLGRSAVFEIGFTENLISQQTTADFGVFFGLDFRL